MKKVLIAFILVGLWVIPTGVALAAPLFDTIVDEGETVNNDVTVFGENLVVKEGATVKGSVFVFGGNATINGRIDGDVVVFGGTVDVASKIDGDMVLFGGDLQTFAGADVRGDCVLLGGALSNQGSEGIGCTAAGGKLPDFVTRLGQEGPVIDISVPRAGRLFFELLNVAISTLVMTMLAFLVATFLPRQVQRVAGTAQQKLLPSGVVGVLTAVAVPSIVALLLPISILLTFVCIGLLGFPIILALLVGLLAGSVLGWVGVGQLVGERLAERLRLKNRSLPVTAAAGTLVMTLAINLLGALLFGFVAGLLSFAVVSVGLGAVMLTQFGTKNYPWRLSAGPHHVVIQMGDDVVVDDEKVTAVLKTLPVEDLRN